MQEVKKLEKVHLDRIERLLKDRDLGAAINDYNDGTRSYFLTGAHSQNAMQPLTIEQKSNEYILSLRMNDETFVYKEDKDNVLNNPNSEIAKLTETITKRYNEKQHEKAATKKAEQQEAEIAARKLEKQNSKGKNRLNAFYIARINLLLKDDKYLAWINDYKDGKRTFLIQEKDNFLNQPLTIDYDGGNYVLRLKTDAGTIDYTEDKGNVANNPNSSMAKITEAILRRYNDGQHKKAAVQKAEQQALQLAAKRAGHQ